MTTFELHEIEPYNEILGYAPKTLYVNGVSRLAMVSHSTATDYVRRRIRSEDTYREVYRGGSPPIEVTGARYLDSEGIR